MSWLNLKHYDPGWSLEGSYIYYIAVYRAEVPTGAKSWGWLEVCFSPWHRLGFCDTSFPTMLFHKVQTAQSPTG